MMFANSDSEAASSVATMGGSSSCAPSFPDGGVHAGSLERVSANTKAASAPSDLLLQHVRCSLPWVAAQQSVALRKMRTVEACERSRIRTSSSSDGSIFRAFGEDVSENHLEAIDVTMEPPTQGEFRRRLRRHRARHTPTSFLFGTNRGNAMLLAIGASTLICGGAISWALAGECEPDCGYDNTAKQSFWLSWGIFFDPGTHTGLEASQDNPAKLCVAVVFSVFGFIFNLAVLGIVVEFMRNRLKVWRQRHHRVVANGHVVILGWSVKTLFLLGELAEVETAYPDWKRRWRGVWVTIEQGQMYEMRNLFKVSAQTARLIIVSGDSVGAFEPRKHDAVVLSALVALQSLPAAQSLTRETAVVLSLENRQNVSVAKQLSNKVVSQRQRIVCAAQVLDALLATCMVDTLVGRVMLELMSTVGNEIRMLDARKLLAAAERPVRFGELASWLSYAVAIGVVVVDEERAEATAKVLLAPDETQLVRVADKLLVLCEDMQHVRLSQAKLQAERLRSTRDVVQSVESTSLRTNAPVHKSALGTSTRLGLRSSRGRSAAGKATDGDASGRSAEALRTHPAAAADGAARAARAARSGTFTNLPPVSKLGSEPYLRTQCVLIIGWMRSLGTLLRALDDRAAVGSEVWILSERSEAARTVDLEAEGLGFSCKSDDSFGYGLRHTRVFHEFGLPTEMVSLQKLPLTRATCAVVFDDGAAKHLGITDTQITDAETLVALLHLQSALGFDDVVKERNGLSMTLVPQFRDNLELLYLGQNPELLEPKHRSQFSSLPFHRTYLEASAHSIAAYSSFCWKAIELLLYAPSCVAIRAVSAAQVLSRRDLCLNPEQRTSGKSLDFHDLSERARLFHHGVLLGWKRADEETSRLKDRAAALRSLKADLISVVDESTARGLRGVEFNPKDKTEKLRWHDTDRLILLVRLPEARYSIDSSDKLPRSDCKD